MLCSYCYNNCPSGKISKKAFNLGIWKVLRDLNKQKTTFALGLEETKILVIYSS
jgi:hypothetical protein